MKVKRFSEALLSILLTTAPAFAAGTVFYVSPTGNDDSAGSLEAPFATIGKAVEASAVTPGADTVWFRGGVYLLDESVKISDLKDVIFAAYPGEEPVFRGSVNLGGWTKVRSAQILSKVSPAARNNLYVTDLNKAGIKSFGDPIKLGSRPLLYLNGEEQMLARYPNVGFIYGGKALGKTPIPTVVNGNSGAVEGIFEYTIASLDKWAEESDPKVGGYWFWDWDDAYYSVTEVNTEARSISVDKDKAFRHGLRFFGLNLLCEIDAPGEWYLDRGTGLLYWYAPQNVKPGSSSDNITFTTLSSKFMLSLENCSNVEISGLSFCESRGGAISVKGGENCRLNACRIENFGSTAVVINEGKGHKVDGCVIRHLAASGVKMMGGDRKELIPADFEMSNTLVEDWERFKRTYNGAFTAAGCGIHLHHCEFRDAPSSALSLEGNDLVAEFNIFEDIAKESDDQGGFDLYLNPSMRGIVLRYNYWKNIVGGTRYGVGGIRLDDLITGIQIYGNVFERCGSIEFGAIQIHGGSENVVEDNLFYKCPMAVSFTQYGEEEWHKTFDSIQDVMFKEVDMNSPKYLLKYPEIREFGRNIDVNTVRNNLLVGCNNLFFNENKPQIKSNNIMIGADGYDAAHFCDKNILHPLGIKAIPIREMGIRSNKWL